MWETPTGSKAECKRKGTIENYLVNNKRKEQRSPDEIEDDKIKRRSEEKEKDELFAFGKSNLIMRSPIRKREGEENKELDKAENLDMAVIVRIITKIQKQQIGNLRENLKQRDESRKIEWENWKKENEE